MPDQFDEDEDVDDEAVEDEWLYVDALGSRGAYRDMERFITDGPDLVDASRLCS